MNQIVSSATAHVLSPTYSQISPLLKSAKVFALGASNTGVDINLIINYLYRIENILAPRSDESAVAIAPWLEGVRVHIAFNSNVGPMPETLSAEYAHLFMRLNELQVNCEVAVDALETARRLLRWTLFSGATAPYINWHSDAVVFIWKNLDGASFFTITGTDFSYLKEEGGLITARKDDVDLTTWSAIFPMQNAVYHA